MAEQVGSRSIPRGERSEIYFKKIQKEKPMSLWQAAHCGRDICMMRRNVRTEAHQAVNQREKGEYTQAGHPGLNSWHYRILCIF